MEVSSSHPPKKRILYVITKANWGGAQRYVYDLATAARVEGYETAVACGSEGELTDRLKAAGVPVMSIGSMWRDIKIGSDIEAFRSLVNIVREFRPDIVHTNSSKAGGLAALAARIGGARHVVFTAHGWAFNEQRPVWQKAIIALLHYATVLLSNDTICVSNAIQHDARYMVGVQKRFTVIHSGVSAIDFYDRDTARARLAPDTSASLWIGTVAELHPVKQVEVLIRAFNAIAKQHPDTALIIMGEGQERARLESLIQELDLTERVRLCGHVSEAARYLTALDIFVLPSRSEALAFAILEAGMATLPVIASRVGGIPEILRNNATGILTPSGDSEKLADAIDMLIKNPATRAEFGTALHTRVIQSFSKTRMIARTFSLYER